MRTVISGFCVLALVAGVAIGCTERSDRVSSSSDSSSERNPPASPRTAPTDVTPGRSAGSGTDTSTPGSSMTPGAPSTPGSSTLPGTPPMTSDSKMGMRVEGKIKSVGAGGVVTLDDGTKLTIPASVMVPKDQLKPGAMISAEYEEKAGQKVATSVQIKS
jgi:hypothetical protein